MQTQPGGAGAAGEFLGYGCSEGAGDYQPARRLSMPGFTAWNGKTRMGKKSWYDRRLGERAALVSLGLYSENRFL